ncbi:TPR-like protein [Ramicandelaber brevisporus]|nr:TPR-like protein [Ramicandelaber brevisporus]
MDTQQLKARADDLFKRGQYADAIDAYKQAAVAADKASIPQQDKPNALIAVLYANRALCYIKLNNYQAAWDNCKIAVTYDETNVKAWYRRGECEKTMGYTGEASRSFKRVLELDPSNKSAQTSLNSLPKSTISATSPPAAPVSVPTSAPAVVQIKQVYDTTLQPPASPTEFIRAWRSCGDNNQWLYSLISSVPTRDLALFLNSELDADRLARIAVVLRDFYLQANQHEECFRVLQALATTSRFDLTMWLVSDADQSVLKGIFGEIESKLGQSDELAQLKNQYRV